MKREMIKGEIELIIGSRPTIWKMKVSLSFPATTWVWFHASNGDMFAFGSTTIARGSRSKLPKRKDG